jgi:uncharacterized repeat protein (TIGR02543 family)
MGRLISKKYKVPGSVKTVLLFLMLIAFSKSRGQAILTFDFAGAAGNEATYASSTNNANINSSTITRSGLTAAANGDRFGSTNFPTSASIDLTKYIEFTVTPLAGFQVSITSVVFLYQRSGTGPLTFALRSSLDSYTSNLGGALAGTDVTSTQTFNFSFSTLTPSCGSPVTFRLYAYAAEATGGTGGPEDGGNTTNKDIVVNGSVSSCGSTHTVTFNANTGTGSMAAQTASTTTNLTTNAFTKAGCTFTGWNTAANGSGTVYSDGQAYSFAADLTLYAQWSCSGTTHTVTFNANTGTGSMAAQTASTTTNLTNNAFTKAGCTFNGWNTVADGSGTAYSDGQAYSFAADLTLYAQWNCGSTCPYFVAAVVNACAGSCSGEGNNEFVVMNSGSYSIPVNGTDLNLVYNNGVDNYFTQSYAAQPGVISNLNSLAGCGTLFVDASTGTIPPNSTFFVMNQGSCFNSGSFSAYCGVGTIYVAFSTDATWSSAGFFGNNNSTRFFRTDFTSINAGCGAVTYNYNVSNEFSFGSDGASVVFNGTTPSYVTGGGDCVPPVTILPISLLDFYGTKNNEVNELVWKVAEEDNILNYIVEKSEDAVHFTELGTVPLNHTKTGSSVKTYNLTDDAPFKGITYYRLSTNEANGSRINYAIISIDENTKEWEYTHYQQDADLIVEFKNAVPKNSTMDLFDLSGKLLGTKTIDQSHVKMNVNELAAGIYFVRITTAYKTENFKIVIQK